MKLHNLIAAAALALGAIGASVTANAHTRVVSSAPAQGAAVAATRVVTLNFNEALLPPTTAATIVMTAMPGAANHSEMAVRNFTTAWSNNNRTLTLNLRQPLRAGRYEVRWQGAGADGHRMSGTVAFSVR